MSIVITTLTLGSQLNVECKGPWGQESVCRGETHTLAQMGENGRDGVQWLTNALPIKFTVALPFNLH
jgi:hypothetical protein